MKYGLLRDLQFFHVSVIESIKIPAILELPSGENLELYGLSNEFI